MKGIFLLLGTNLGDKLLNLRQASDILQAYEMTIIDYSSIFESAPWGEPNQDWFLNVVIRVDTIHQPESLLQVCLKAEQQMGRQRIKKWSSRIIDIDLLYYDNYEMKTESLTLPHPAIQMRKFTLMPLVEIAPDEIHPVLNLTNRQLLDICPDELPCKGTNLKLIV